MILPLLLGLTVATSSAGVHRSAIIVGVNDAFEDGQPTLRYADDDAARYFEMFQPMFDRVELLAVLDKESQAIFPRAAERASTPDLETLRAAVARADRAASHARGEGRRTELFFVYIGHGRVQGGEGAVKLRGGSLDRSTLTELVLQKTTHDRTHVIVDACNAYHLVNARGADTTEVTKDFDSAFEKFVASQSVDRFATVGVVLSTNGPGATLEWSRLLGGVFSHEVRSALTGAADADEDGRIDYTEVAAFLASANIDVPALKGKPNVYVRAPAIERGAPLIVHDDRLPAIELPAELDGHYVIEDDRGVRYAELHKALGYTVELRLVPRARYTLLNRDGGELWSVDDPKGVVRLTLPLGDGRRPALERGGALPPGMFAEAYGPAFLDGFRARERLTTAITTPPPSAGIAVRPIVGWAAVAVGVIAVSVAAWQGVVADRNYERYQGTSRDSEKAAFGSQFRRERDRATVLGIVGGVTLATGIGVLVWDFVE